MPLLFDSAINERLNQIYIAAHRWKEEILNFPMMYHTSKSVTCIKFKGRAMIIARQVNEKVRSESILYLRLVLIKQC